MILNLYYTIQQIISSQNKYSNGYDNYDDDVIRNEAYNIAAYQFVNLSNYIIS